MEEQEHPAHRAARMIKEMHEKTIEMIDNGQKFTHTDKETGEVKDVSQEMREKCAEQVIMCDEVMARAAGMGPEHTAQAQELLVELTATVQPTIIHEEIEEPELPEMGDYKHYNGGE